MKSTLQNPCILYEDLCKRVFEGVIKRKKQLESCMRAVSLPASKNFCRGLMKFFAYIFTALALYAFVPEFAHAAELTPAEESAQALAGLIGIFISGLNQFLWFFLILIGSLFDNDLILGPGMEARLLNIWQGLRDLVNIIFVVFLLVIAVYNVFPFSDGEGNLALKTALPRLIAGIVLVNFTFLGGKIVMDLSSLATTAAFALPELVDDFNFTHEKEQFEQSICWKPGTALAPDRTQYSAAPAFEKDIPIYTKLFCEKDEEELFYTGKIIPQMDHDFFQELNQNNIGVIMAVNMGALGSLELLKPEGIHEFKDLLVNGLFSLVLYIIFAITYIVLGLVLVARIVVLWTLMALSPIGVLVFVIPQIREAVGGGGGDIVSQIIKHLTAPVIIGVSMSLGFLMIEALGDTSGALTTFQNISSDDFLNTEFLASNITNMEQFLIAIITIAVLWMGVFAAAEGTIAKTATDTIRGFGESVGGALVKAPLYAPIVPTGVSTGNGPLRVSIGSVLGLAKNGLDAVKYGTIGQDNMNQFLKANPGLNRLMPGNASTTNTPTENAQNITNSTNNISQKIEALINNVRSHGDASSKADLLRKIEGIQVRINKNDSGSAAALSELKSLVNANKDKLGFEPTQKDAVEKAIQDSTLPPKPEPKSEPPAEAPVAPPPAVP